MKKRYEPLQSLKLRRIEKGMTQERLAKIVGVGQSLISCYETGANFPKRQTLFKLAEALGCEVKDLL